MLVIFFACSILFASEWPVKLAVSEKQTDMARITLNFSEKRFGDFAAGFIFSSPETEVTSFDSGKIIFSNDSTENYFEDFPSTLGTSIVLAHKDKLISVYANLTEINEQLLTEDNIESESVIAKTGGSDEMKKGFHRRNESLEFQLIDTKNRAVINSYMLLPHLKSGFVVYPGSIHLEDKKGNLYSLDSKKSFSSGTYSVYRSFSTGRMPVKTAVFVNGNDVSAVNYDMLISKNGILSTTGKFPLSFERVFSRPGLQYAGDVQLIRGKTELSLVVTDFNNNDRKVTYYLDIY
ncbi:MAG: M23 family metallopeptidase [Treponemataceae bacterium]|nr:M23 family metallopeptidase [Treponemataceae bacterium]